MREDYDDLIQMMENDVPGFRIEQIHALCFRDKWVLNDKLCMHNVSIGRAWTENRKQEAIGLLCEVRDELHPPAAEDRPGPTDDLSHAQEEETRGALRRQISAILEQMRQDPALPAQALMDQIDALWREHASLQHGDNMLTYDEIRAKLFAAEYGKAAGILGRLCEQFSSEAEQIGKTAPTEAGMSIEQLRMEAHTRLTMLRKAIERVSPEAAELQTIDAMLEKMRKHPYTLAVVGEFNRGKSSLINALLGMHILPADVTPTTATINRVVYAEAPGVRLYMQDGSEEDIPFTMLKARVTKLSEEAEAAANRVREAVISYPTVFCRNNVSILDTPGLNESQQMDELTLSHARRADAVVFLISALVPFSQSEAQAIIRLLTDSNIRHVLFTVSFIDRLPQEAGVEERVLSSIRRRIARTAFPLIDADPHLSPEERERQKDMLNQAPVLGVSAKKALDAFVSGSVEDLKQSHIEEYKRELMTRLTAQQDEWLSRDAMPYVQRTLNVFNEAAQRRIAAFQGDIQAGQELIAQAKAQLSSLTAERLACINRWANAVRRGVGSKGQLKEELYQVVDAHMRRYPDPGAVNLGAGLKQWAKRQGVYRDESDPATQQLRAAFEDVREVGVDMCYRADAIARVEYLTACSEIAALAQRAYEGLNRAIKMLRAKRDELTLPAWEPQGAEIALFGAEGINLLQAMPMPGVSLGPFDGAKRSLGDAVAERFYAKLENSLRNVSINGFPHLIQIQTQGNAVIAELEQRIVHLNERLAKLREEAKTMEKLL